MVEPGSVVLDKYRVERILGSGGMGVVALVRHLNLDEPMAIKFLQPQMLAKRDVPERFLREAKAAAKLKGEHVCRVFDVGTMDNGVPYMIMEYLHGVDLDGYLKQYGSLPLAVTIDILIQACAGLAEAHALGIVHRDVKPANFFLTQRTDGSPLVKLLDFGISKSITQEGAALTRDSALLGTPAYMSPEQVRSSREVDARADVWSLGVILYELLSGHRPFQAATATALCLEVCMEEPTPLAVSLPPGLADVVMRCLEKDPERRIQSATELADALAPYHDPSLARPRPRTHSGLESTGPVPAPPALEERTTTGEQPPSAPTTLSSGAGHVHAPRSHAAQRRSHKRWLAALLGLLVVLLLVLLATEGADDPASDSAASETARIAPTSAPAPTPEDQTGPEARDPSGPPPEHPVSSGLEADAAPAVQADEAIRDASAPAPGPADPPIPDAPRVFTIEADPVGANVITGGKFLGTAPIEVELKPGERRRYAVAHRAYKVGHIDLPDDADDENTARITLERVTTSQPTGKSRSLEAGGTMRWK